MTPSQLLRQAKALLATPDNVEEDNHDRWICAVLEAAAGGTNTTVLEIEGRITDEIKTLAPGETFALYPTALAWKLGVPAACTAWRQEVRHEFVDRLIVEYEAAGR
jgi:hypothetical protein